MQVDMSTLHETMLAMTSAMNEIRNEVQRNNDFLQMVVAQQTIERAHRQPIGDDEADDSDTRSHGFVELMEAFAATAVNQGNTSTRPDAAPPMRSGAAGVTSDADVYHTMVSNRERRQSDEPIQMQRNIDSWLERQRAAKGGAQFPQ